MLPDMDHSTDEQDREIAGLEEKIKLQREMLDKLRNAGQLLGEDTTIKDS